MKLNNNIEIQQGDCCELIKKLPDASVDAIITDPPYGITGLNWDKEFSSALLMTELHRIIKPRGSIIIFSTEPFTSKLITGNLTTFKYRLTWIKNRPSGFVNCKAQPLKTCEDICIFSKAGASATSKNLMVYNPQMTKGKPYVCNGNNKRLTSVTNNALKPVKTINNGFRYPKNVIFFNRANKNEFHPTQKPLDLMEYIVKTYSNDNDTVIDCFMGSGTTGIACINTNRRFIGMEIDLGYFNIAEKRLKNHLKQPNLTAIQ